MVYEDRDKQRLKSPEERGSRELNDSTPRNPGPGKTLRMKQIISDALAQNPHGEEIDKYFGISTGRPEQSLEEAERAEYLLGKLRDLATSKSVDSKGMLRQIADHVDGSGFDANALRALMRGSKKPAKEPEEGQQ